MPGHDNYPGTNEANFCITQSKAWKVENFPQAPRLKNSGVTTGQSDIKPALLHTPLKRENSNPDIFQKKHAF